MISVHVRVFSRDNWNVTERERGNAGCMKGWRRGGVVLLCLSTLFSSPRPPFFLCRHPRHSSTFPSHTFHFSLSSRPPDVSVESAHFNLFCLNAINGQTHIHTNTCAHTDVHSFTQPTFSLSHHDTNSPSLSSLFSLSFCLSSLSFLSPLSRSVSLLSLHSRPSFSRWHKWAPAGSLL